MFSTTHHKSAERQTFETLSDVLADAFTHSRLGYLTEPSDVLQPWDIILHVQRTPQTLALRGAYSMQCGGPAAWCEFDQFGVVQLDPYSPEGLASEGRLTRYVFRQTDDAVYLTQTQPVLKAPQVWSPATHSYLLAYQTESAPVCYTRGSTDIARHIEGPVPFEAMVDTQIAAVERYLEKRVRVFTLQGQR
jgi:hypothetical protein